MKHSQRGGIIFRLITLMALVAAALALYAVRFPLLRLAGGFWVVENDNAGEQADAIVVLGDDNFAGDRASRASELFHAGRAPKVVASGRMLRPYAGVAELISRDLESRGVPASAVVLFPHTANDTREEAESLRRLVSERGWRRIIVVTSNYHTRRAAYIFRKEFPHDVRVSVASARDSDFDANTWWQSRKSRKIFFLEGVGFCVALWELRKVGA